MDQARFRDPAVARELIGLIGRLCADRPLNLMEVCGTHTVSIGRHGLRAAMPEGLRLLSGPGCPVCVTSNHDIDCAIAMARVPGAIVTTFGDMMRVPGSSTTLGAEKAAGADVRVVYSPLDALSVARANPGRPVVFISVGFETTAPVAGATVQMACEEGLSNFYLYCAHKTTAPALRAIASDPAARVDGFILPGHVASVTGLAPFRFLVEEFGVPGVVSGFEPVDVLSGVVRLCAMAASGQARVENAYGRGVSDEGNPAALAVIEEVFEPCDAVWRGLGPIPGSGLRLRGAFAARDALAAFSPAVEPERENPGCRCGDVLRGAISPRECPLFDRACTPENPVGPCMVSSEGSCAAYWRYRE